MSHDFDQAAPSDWISLVNERGDLDLAFSALDGWNHFHTDTIRGRIRSLQLRPAEAWDFFEKAEEGSRKFPRNARNVLRRFYLQVYRFENAVLEESSPAPCARPDAAGPCPGSRPGIEEHLRALLEADAPDSEVAGQIRLFNKATFLLNHEDYRAARELFLRLLRESRNRNGDEMCGFYLGAAVTHRALGEIAEADRQLDNASLSIPVLSNTFNMGIYAGSLSALLRIWRREEEAREWDGFLARLKIPEKTVELFRERSHRILERSVTLRRVFLF